MSRLLAQVAGLFVAPEADVLSVGESTVEGNVRPLPEDRQDAPASAATPGPRPSGAEFAWRPPVGGQWSSAPAPAPAPGASSLDRRREADRSSAAHSRLPRSAVVLGASADAIPFGAALAGELRVRSRARTSLLLVWDPAGLPAAPTPAWPAARQLATELADRHEVAARGRLVQLRLPGEATAAATVAGHLSEGARVPTVLVLGGPRAEAFDPLLSDRELLIVLDAAGAHDSLAELAAAQLRRLNARVEVERPIDGNGRRVLASWGMGRARSLGARLEMALR